jgi:hypothetical protein
MTVNMKKNLAAFWCIAAIASLTECTTSSEKNEQTGLTNRTAFYINNQEEFDRLSGFEFPSGSDVLFAVDQVFAGQFVIRGEGTKEQLNRVAAYDPESKEVFVDWIDNKPIINGGGSVKSALLLKNSQHWEVTNIEVTNTNGSFDEQGKILGIHVVAEDAGIVENIRIANCYVHHVNGHVGGKQTGGIQVHVLGEEVITKFNNLVIEDNRVAHVGGVGISNQSSWGNINTPTYHPWTNFIIRRNRVEQTGRNGIIVRYSINPLVEYNTLAYNSRFDTGHSVFNFNTINCVVQYNEAYGNTSNNPDDIDHGGFDADYNSVGTIIQYNYSHDNNWFCGIMRRKINDDITIRYNISQNERLGLFLYGFPTEVGVTDVKIYNNTFYAAKGMANRVFVQAGKIRIPTQTTFINNIFYFEEEAEWGFEPDSTCSFENNLYFNLSAKGDNEMIGIPLFVDPGNGQSDIDMTDPDRLAGYRLKMDSPAAGNGILVEGNGGLNFWGETLVEGALNVGM